METMAGITVAEILIAMRKVNRPAPSLVYKVLSNLDKYQNNVTTWGKRIVIG